MLTCQCTRQCPGCPSHKGEDPVSGHWRRAGPRGGSEEHHTRATPRGACPLLGPPTPGRKCSALRRGCYLASDWRRPEAREKQESGVASRAQAADGGSQRPFIHSRLVTPTRYSDSDRECPGLERSDSWLQVHEHKRVNQLTLLVPVTKAFQQDVGRPDGSEDEPAWRV